MLSTHDCLFSITDPFSVATIENGELIPSDVYQNINESLELKCLLDAHLQKLNEVNSINISYSFDLHAIFVFLFL